MRKLSLRPGDEVAVGSTKQYDEGLCVKALLVRAPQAKSSTWVAKQDDKEVQVPANQCRALWTDYKAHVAVLAETKAKRDAIMLEDKKALEIILNHLGGMGVSCELVLLNNTRYTLCIDASQASAIAELRRGKK